MKKILFISYDGLTDPLGQSQILPYIMGLSEYGYRFTVLSFEKPDRLQREKQIIQKLTTESRIQWVSLPFTSRPRLISKFYDAIQMRRKAVALQKEQGFDMVHCRSYIAADVGLCLKQRFGIKFFFDMRGFWADEKKDGGSWNMSNPVFKQVYKYYKNKEALYLQNADYIISLTEAGKNEMVKWPSYKKDIPIQVIPCCADLTLFSPTNEEQKKQSKKNLDISNDEFVLSYLGSIGTWYMLEEMLLFFRQLKKHYTHAKFLFITHTPKEVIEEGIAKLNLQHKDFIIREATRKEVPDLIKATDVNISFIKPVYSKISSSPTKLGEVLAMGIPVICNGGIGDVEKIVNDTNGGYIVQGFTPSDFEGAIAQIPHLLQKKPQEISKVAGEIYSLNRGVDLYAACYKQIFA